ncbi:DNA repair protein XRCC1 [Drosophila bipectinata]|uniref:DNA repair protein XRCC1 n=1 Tax=Drosophila bipectinata TaxID=42026 RepID=UPI001C8A9753|nr:DNA repair protein XRCC1 [Drosophila bipectinata]
MPIAVFKSVREVSSEDSVHSAENLLKENAGKKWRIKSSGEKSAYVILEFQEAQQITGIDIGNEHSAFIDAKVSRTMASDDFKELLLSSSFMTPIESKNSSNQNRVRCFGASALNEDALKEKWTLLKITCTQPFNRHVQYGISFVKVHVVAAPTTNTSAAAAPKVKSLLPEKLMTFGGFKLREDSPDSESDSTQLSRFQRWKKESHQQSPAATTAAAIRDAGSSALRRLSNGIAGTSSGASTTSPAAAFGRSGTDSPPVSDAKRLDRNRESLLFGEEDEDESLGEISAKKRRLSKQLEADKDRRRIEQEKEKEHKSSKSKRLSLDRSSSKEANHTKKEDRSSSKEDKTAKKEDHSSSKEVRTSEKEDKPSRKVEKAGQNKSHDVSTTKVKESPRPSTQKRHSSPSGRAATPAKKQKVLNDTIQYRPFNQLLRGVVLVISGIQNPDRADLRSKATSMGAKYKADWEPGCTHLICAFKNTPKYNQVKGKGKIVTRSWLEKCHSLKKYLPWRRYALDTADLGQPESDEELCDETMKPRRESSDADDVVVVNEDRKMEVTYDGDKKDVGQEASSGIDTEDELEKVAQKNSENKKKRVKSPVMTKSDDIYDASTDEEDYLAEKKKQIVVLD